MSTNIPTTRQTKWSFLLVHFIVISIIFYILYLLKFEETFIFISGGLTYLALSIGLKKTVAREHIQGIKLVNKHQFEKAIPLFEKSVKFFAKHNDKYRFITLLSASKMTYKEMGLCNAAFCYSQIGKGQKAKEYYEKTLQEFPKNSLAIIALNMINSYEEITKPKI